MAGLPKLVGRTARARLRRRGAAQDRARELAAACWSGPGAGSSGHSSSLLSSWCAAQAARPGPAPGQFGVEILERVGPG